MTDEEVSCARREKPFRSNSTGHGLGMYFLKSVPISEICGSISALQASSSVQPRDLTDTGTGTGNFPQGTDNFAIDHFPEVSF
jgi:hypothetical protein